MKMWLKRETRAPKMASPSDQVPHEAILTTSFVPWCSRVFTEPILERIQSETTPDGMSDPILTKTNPTDWACHVEEGMQQISAQEFAKLNARSCDVSETYFCVGVDAASLATCTTTSHRMKYPMCTDFSKLRAYLYFSDGDNIGIVFYEENRSKIVRVWPNHAGNPFTMDRCNWMSVMNGSSTEMLLTGSASGVIRLWNPNFNRSSHVLGDKVSFVTAAFPLADQTRLYPDKASKADTTLYDWNEESGRLLCAGNVKVCRVWDAHTEKVLYDIVPSSKKGTVSAISSDLDGSTLIAIGLRDGRILVHDTRIPKDAPDSRILTLAEHSTPLVGLSLRSRVEDGRAVLAAASQDGLLCVWEPRMYKEPIVELRCIDNDRDKLSSMIMHGSGQMMAASVRGCEEVRVYDISGKPISTLKSHQDLLAGSRHLAGRPTSLSFHPFRPLLAVSTVSLLGEQSLAGYGPPPSALLSALKR